jgi:glutathione S-transferase
MCFRADVVWKIIPDRISAPTSAGLVASASDNQGVIPGSETMKFYDCTTAPSPRRVRIFLAEKGITVPTVQVDLRNNEQLTPEFRAINWDATVPVLALDDGTRIADAVAICLYFEELHPEPPLMGVDARDKAIVTQWQRIVERDGFYAVMEAFRNATPGLKNRALPGPHGYAQIPALAERGRERISHFYELLDRQLADHPFVAGERFSIADISALVAVDFARWVKLPVPHEYGHLRRWHETVSARPSADA